MDAKQEQPPTQIDHALTVHSQCFDRRASCRRSADDARVIFVPAKVFVPIMQSRMEQGNDLLREGIKGFDLVILAPVAAGTEQRKVVLFRCAAARNWKDVFGGKRFCCEGQRRAAVFASPICPLLDGLAQAFGYVLRQREEPSSRGASSGAARKSAEVGRVPTRLSAVRHRRLRLHR